MTIDDLIALGTGALRDESSAALIPIELAPELARRWLFDAARDRERAVVRAAEAVAYLSRYKEDREREQAEGQAEKAFYDWLNELPIVHIRVGNQLEEILPSIPDRLWRQGETYKAWKAGDTKTALELVNAFTKRRQTNIRARLEHEQQEWLREVDRMIERRAKKAGIAWASDLITLSFSLADGSRVTWGDATIAQHRARRLMLSTHAAAELASATRHEAAIKAITNQPGAACLADVLGVPSELSEQVA